jgi:hypothetical protein
MDQYHPYLLTESGFTLTVPSGMFFETSMGRFHLYLVECSLKFQWEVTGYFTMFPLHETLRILSKMSQK